METANLARCGVQEEEQLCCLICSSEISRLEEEEEESHPFSFPFFPGSGFPQSVSLNDHMWSIFLLRNLLEFPREEVVKLLARSGSSGIKGWKHPHPGDWIRVCGACSELVEKAGRCHLQILRAEEELQKVKEELGLKLKESLEGDDDDGGFNGVGVEGSRGYRKEIRDYLRENPISSKVVVVEAKKKTTDEAEENRTSFIAKAEVATQTDRLLEVEIRDPVVVPIPMSIRTALPDEIEISEVGETSLQEDNQTQEGADDDIKGEEGPVTISPPLISSYWHENSSVVTDAADTMIKSEKEDEDDLAFVPEELLDKEKGASAPASTRIILVKYNKKTSRKRIVEARESSSSNNFLQNRKVMRADSTTPLVWDQLQLEQEALEEKRKALEAETSLIRQCLRNKLKDMQARRRLRSPSSSSSESSESAPLPVFIKLEQDDNM